MVELICWKKSGVEWVSKLLHCLVKLFNALEIFIFSIFTCRALILAFDRRCGHSFLECKYSYTFNLYFSCTCCNNALILVDLLQWNLYRVACNVLRSRTLSGYKLLKEYVSVYCEIWIENAANVDWLLWTIVFLLPCPHLCLFSSLQTGAISIVPKKREVLQELGEGEKLMMMNHTAR